MPKPKGRKQMASCGIEIRTFDDLRFALNARKQELGLKNLDLDEICSFQGGYASKLLCGMKRPGDKTLPAILDGLGVVLSLRHASPEKHQETEAETTTSIEKRKKVLSERQKIAARITRIRHGDKFMRKRARLAARARWSAVKKRKKEPRAAKAAAAEKAAEKECLSPVKSGG